MRCILGGTGGPTEYHAESLPTLLAFAGALGLLVFALRERRNTAALPLAALMAAVLLWTGFAFLEESSRALAAKVAWSNLQYAGIAAAPALWLLFIVRYVKPDRRIPPWMAGVLAVEPLAVNVLVWAEGGSGWYYRSVELAPRGASTVLRHVYGPAFWVHTAYSYLLLAAATALMVVVFLRVSRPERRRIAPVLYGVALPWAANAWSIFGLAASDVTPLGITAACVVFAFGVRLRERERQVRDDDERQLYDLMRHAPLGILLVDGQGVIRYANGEADRLCGCGPGELVDQPLDRVIPERVRTSHRELCAGFLRQPATRPMGVSGELTARRGDGTELPVDVGLHSIVTRKGTYAVAFLTDATARRQAEWAQKEYEERLREANDGLEERVAVRTRQLAEAQAQIVSQLRLQQELELAAEVQKSLLPRHIPSPEGFELSAIALPARSVGGDIYDFTMPRPGECLVALGDISGKGIPAALLTSTARALFRAESAHETSPGRILASVNAAFHDDLSHAEMFMTLLVARLEAGGDRLTVANAGSCRVILFRRLEGACSELEAGGLPLGIFPSSQWSEETVFLRPGDAAVLYSDGITEAEDPEGRLFGLQALQDAVCAGARGTTADLLRAILGAVEAHRRGAPASDDVTLVLIRALPRVIRRAFDLSLDTLDALVGTVRAAASVFGSSFADELEVAVSEIATNILRHGYAGARGPVQLEVGVHPDRVAVGLRDQGIPFDLGSVSGPDLERPRPGGYGIHIARSYTDELVHETAGSRGNRWRMVKIAKANGGGKRNG